MVMLSFIFLILFNFNLSKDLRMVYSIMKGGNNVPNKLNDQGYDVLGELWDYSGEITALGLRSQFLLGRAYYQKYKGFISDSFKYNEWFIGTTDFNKTEMSVQAFMIGVYPSNNLNLTSIQESNAKPPIRVNYDTKPLNGNVFPSNIQVFPYHVFQETNKKYFYLYGFRECKPITRIFNNNTNRVEVLDFISNFKANYSSKLVNVFNQLNDTFLNDYDFLFNLMDTYTSGYLEGKRFDVLVKNNIDLVSFYNVAQEFLQLDLNFKYNGDDNFMLSKITTSSLLDQLITWIENRILLDKNENFGYFGYLSPKMISLSLHDISISSLMVYLNKVFNSKILSISKSSQLIFELYSQNDMYFVSIFYNDNLLIENIPYNEFKTGLYKYYMTEEQILDFCYDMPSILVSESFVDIIYRNLLIIFAVGATVFFIAFIILIICCCCCFRRKSNKEENVIDNERKNTNEFEHYKIATTEPNTERNVIHKL